MKIMATRVALTTATTRIIPALVAFWPRAQLARKVRALPRCSEPVGDGARRVVSRAFVTAPIF